MTNLKDWTYVGVKKTDRSLHSHASLEVIDPLAPPPQPTPPHPAFNDLLPALESAISTSRVCSIPIALLSAGQEGNQFLDLLTFQLHLRS